MIICVRILCKCLSQTWEKFHYHNRHTLSSSKHTDTNCYCMSDRLGWETVLASQQLKDLEATPLDDPRPRHFVISSSRAHVTSSRAPWPGKPATDQTSHVIIQINYQSVDCLNLSEHCRSDMRQQFVSFHVQRFFYKCSTIYLLSDNL